MLLFLLLTALLCGCGNPSERFSYRQKPFTAQLEGQCGGVKFLSEIGSCEDGIYVEYLQPSALCGVRLEWCDGTCRVTLDSLTLSMREEELSVWLEPLRVLMFAEEVSRLQKVGEDTHLFFGTDASLVLSEVGVPLRGTGKYCEFSVTWWQTETLGS